MSRNGSGGYSLPSNSWNPAVNGVTATAADWQALINDVATAIQQSVSADGQTPITGNLQMGGNKLTGLAAGSGTGQSLRFEQLFSQGTLTDIASAATVDIGAQLTNFLRVTGTTTITSFGTNYNGPKFLIFASAVTLTHSATLVLPGAANITTAANDALIAIPISGGWQVVSYQLAAGVSLTVSSLNGGQLAGLRSKIINGKMDIAQRGTNFASALNGTGVSYLLDRWRGSVGSMASFCTVTQQADAPASNEFQNSLRVAVTTADASITAAKFAVLTQPIEGYNVRDLIGKTFTISFWVRSSKTGIHCVALRNSGSDRSWVSEYTINAANTWEYKTITVTGGLPTAGTWNWTTGIGLDLNFVLAAGSTYQITAGAWQTGSFFDTANQVNCLDTVGNIFAITGVQLEVGTVATPFEHRPYGDEFIRCQRYRAQRSISIRGTSGPSNFIAHTVPFPQEMRAVPSLALAGTISSGNVASEQLGTLGSTTTNSCVYQLTCTVANADTYMLNRIIIMDAEI